jgi:hypothetical protein
VANLYVPPVETARKEVVANPYEMMYLLSSFCDKIAEEPLGERAFVVLSLGLVQ